MVTHIKGKRIHYKATHPLYGSDNIFDSWMTLCEATFDLAKEEISRRIDITKAISDLSDEMIESAEEYEPA